jgi:hypothetical protein
MSSTGAVRVGHWMLKAIPKCTARSATSTLSQSSEGFPEKMDKKLEKKSF